MNVSGPDSGVCGSEAEHRLFSVIFSSYNQYIRPVENVSEPVIVQFEVSMSQLVKVVRKTHFCSLRWDPKDFGGVEFIRVPSKKIWKPDIVLYNNAVGDFQVDDKTKALLRYNGDVTWIPPAIFKSSCKIDVTFFPFDYQNCTMKFGSWTYDKAKIDLVLIGSTINLKDFWESGEWTIIDAPGYKHDIKYNCCEEIYTDITYSLYIRRLPLFYTINMIIPCLLISFLTVLVFYLPSDCGEKVTLCISVLLSLTLHPEGDLVHFCSPLPHCFPLGHHRNPSTSLVIPLIGEYLLFTMIFVTLSIVITVFVLNVHYRTPKTHTMPGWVRKVFLGLLPWVMFMTRPEKEPERKTRPCALHAPGLVSSKQTNVSRRAPLLLCSSELTNLSEASSKTAPGFLCRDGRCLGKQQGTNVSSAGAEDGGSPCSSSESLDAGFLCMSPQVRDAIESVKYIAQNMRLQNEAKEDDWKYVAMVIDRIFLWVFVLVCILGTAGLFLQPLLMSEDM
uniref:Neuronal acetylcholine receptor subunit alpha-3-like n=1 Tax=Sinocyclocheilus anshuiensis TaxID=1608454 RepID=A0A671NVC7_9TELE